MTEQEKQLLLADLCARLPYKPRVKYGYSFMGVTAISGYTDEGYLNYEELKDFSIFPKYGLERKRVSDIIPYLRPMSSMTEEEFNELVTVTELQYDQLELMDWGNDKTLEFYLSEVPQYCVIKVFDWLNKYHFDYRGLIPMGLAFEALDGMYSIKTTCNNCENKSYCSQSEYVKNNCYKLT